MNIHSMKKFEEETHVVHNMLTCCSMWLATRPREQHIAAALLATLALVVKMDEHIGATNAIERLVWSQLDPEEELRTLVFEEHWMLSNFATAGNTAIVYAMFSVLAWSSGCFPTLMQKNKMEGVKVLYNLAQIFACSFMSIQ
ncbi:hypothetical protein THAOC_00195, partial [Thalassiosira oceanica]